MVRKKVLTSKNLEYEAIVHVEDRKTGKPKILTFKGNMKFPVRVKPILFRIIAVREIKSLSSISKE